MKTRTPRRLVSLIGLLAIFGLVPAYGAECPDYLNQEFEKLHSEETINLCKAFGGKPLLIVNTASYCGFTPQFKSLEALHQEYSRRGLAVVGFPSDDFRQEAASEAKTAEVCYMNYGVTFTMLAPVSIKGPDAHPLFEELARQTSAPRWNFNKYLVRANGEVVKRLEASVKPDSDEMLQAIEKLL